MNDSATIDYRSLKINGIYQQNDAGDLMVRVKLPAGVFSASQADTVCDLAESFADGDLHLTTRGNIEMHGLRGESLPEVIRRLNAVGLTTRGASGGAVRGISCALGEGEGFARMLLLTRCLHAHFTGNPYFEGLPKKIKIAVESGYDSSRHLCQDLALVYLGRENGRDLCDVWVAGGLGRQPREGFLLAGRVSFERIIPLVEGVVKVYLKHAPSGKRLKHLLADIGEGEFRALLAEQTSGSPLCPLSSPVDDMFGSLTSPGVHGWVRRPVFCGQLAAGDLRRVAAIARTRGDGFLAIGRDQELLVSVAGQGDKPSLEQALDKLPWAGKGGALACRACPGSHACVKGLVPTREVAERLDAILQGASRSLRLAVSGCPNSCSQPQLADFGIVGVRKQKGDNAALYDLYRNEGEGFGQPVRQQLTLDEILVSVQEFL